MPERLLYLAIDIGVILIPFLFSFHPRIRFDRHWGAFIKAALVVLIPFIIWDIAFTETGVWGFNPRYLTGVYLLPLPIEEWLFFICIPYACVFTYYCFGLLRRPPAHAIWYTAFAVASMGLLVCAMLFRDRAYTFLTFLLTGCVGGYLALVERPSWLPRAVVSYAVILPFFFISNGLLTGSWIEEQVVWYNNDENLSIRLGTIPVEDSAYGFLLVLLNVMLFERWKKDKTMA